MNRVRAAENSRIGGRGELDNATLSICNGYRLGEGTGVGAIDTLHL